MFPHPCTHCGLCCIAVVCPIGQRLMRVTAKGPCPALEWDETNPDQSRCGLIAHPEHYLPPPALAFIANAPIPLTEALGSGQGCCMSARVLGPQGEQDFAALPPELKTTYVRAIRAL